jgi:hypothetical protein
MRKIFAVISGFVLAISVQAQITVIDDGGTSPIQANAISSDGTYVVGQVGHSIASAGRHTFVFRPEAGFTAWDENGANIHGTGSTAWSVSPTGRVVGLAPDSGHIVSDGENTGLAIITASFRDYTSDSWIALPFLPTVTNLVYGFGNRASAITDDGNIIVGGQTPGGEAQRFSAGYWDVSDPDNIVYHALLTDTRPGNGSEVQTVSGDGKIMGGYETVNSTTYPTLWIEGVKKHLTGLSADAITAVGNNGKYAVLQNNLRAAAYDIEKEELISFDSGDRLSTPSAVSDQGIVAGHWGQPGNSRLGVPDTREAFIYTQASGMVGLKTYLEENGITVPLQTLRVASGISADGKYIAGYGELNGKIVGFHATIPGGGNGINPAPDKDGLKVYPNFIEKGETVRVELSGAAAQTEATLKVYDLTGKKVKEVRIEGDVTPLRMDVAAGTYILKVNEQKATRVIVK